MIPPLFEMIQTARVHRALEAAVLVEEAALAVDTVRADVAGDGRWFTCIGRVYVRAHVKQSKFSKEWGQAMFLHIMNPHALEALKLQ